MSGEERDPSSGWEKARAISTIIATVVIPLAIAFGSNWYGQLQKDKELQLKYIEISVQILSAPPKANEAVRMWAITTINKYSEVKIDEKAERELMRNQLRLIIDKYNETASGVVQSIGR